MRKRTFTPELSASTWMSDAWRSIAVARIRLASCTTSSPITAACLAGGSSTLVSKTSCSGEVIASCCRDAVAGSIRKRMNASLNSSALIATMSSSIAVRIRRSSEIAGELNGSTMPTVSVLPRSSSGRSRYWAIALAGTSAMTLSLVSYADARTKRMPSTGAGATAEGIAGTVTAALLAAAPPARSAATPAATDRIALRLASACANGAILPDSWASTSRPMPRTTHASSAWISVAWAVPSRAATSPKKSPTRTSSRTVAAPVAALTWRIDARPENRNPIGASGVPARTIALWGSCSVTDRWGATFSTTERSTFRNSDVDVKNSATAPGARTPRLAPGRCTRRFYPTALPPAISSGRSGISAATYSRYGSWQQASRLLPLGSWTNAPK